MLTILEFITLLWSLAITHFFLHPLALLFLFDLWSLCLHIGVVGRYRHKIQPMKARQNQVVLICGPTTQIFE